MRISDWSSDVYSSDLLLFERFLNPERVSMPDFDIDFCMDRRDEVIDYVAAKYGRDRVRQIITYGTMAAKAVVPATGRVLGFPYGFVDRSAEHTSELQSLMRSSYAVICLKKNTNPYPHSNM